MTKSERDRAAGNLERLAAWVRSLPASDDRPPARAIHYRIERRTACDLDPYTAGVRSSTRPAFVTCRACAIVARRDAEETAIGLAILDERRRLEIESDPEQTEQYSAPPGLGMDGADVLL